MSKQEFILKLIEEGKDILKMLLPFIIGLHIKQPGYMKKDEDK